jgi:hypothetical protein
MNWREVAMMVPVAGIIFYIGIHPAPLLRRMEPRLQELLTQVEGSQGAGPQGVRAGGMASGGPIDAVVADSAAAVRARLRTAHSDLRAP